jgi:hypothetical protein
VHDSDAPQMSKGVTRVLFVCVCLGLMSVRTAYPQTSNSVSEQAVRQLERELSDAQMTGNADKVSQLLADGYIALDDNGTKLTKKQLIDLLKSGAMKMDSAELGPMDVTVFGNVAVVQGSDTEKYRMRVQNTDGGWVWVDTGGKFVWTDVWVKQGNGKWQEVRTQVHKLAVRDTSTSDQKNEQTSPQLALLASHRDAESDWPTIEGQVQNISGVAIRAVQVVVNWYSRDGASISSEEGLIDFDPLLPSQVSPFKVPSRPNPEKVKYSVMFKSISGSTILFVDRTNSANQQATANVQQNRTAGQSGEPKGTARGAVQQPPDPAIEQQVPPNAPEGLFPSDSQLIAAAQKGFQGSAFQSAQVQVYGRDPETTIKNASNCLGFAMVFVGGPLVQRWEPMRVLTSGIFQTPQTSHNSVALSL